MGVALCPFSWFAVVQVAESGNLHNCKQHNRQVIRAHKAHE
jgi:hypothetical protein